MAVQVHEASVTIRNTLPHRFERKYYLTPEKVGLAYGLLRHTCLPDIDFPSEQMNSLYFDTAELDQHERSSSGDFYKDKVRIRWYGEERDLQGMQTAFLELKSREGFASTKQRQKIQVPAESLKLDNLYKGIVPRTFLAETLAGFGYFAPGLLQPVVKISYWRYRYCELITAQRVSLDCHIRSTMIMPGLGNREKELELPGAVIEVKGKSMEIPASLKRMKMLNIDWGRFSKYSACIDAHTEAPGSVGRMSPSGRIVWP